MWSTIIQSFKIKQNGSTIDRFGLRHQLSGYRNIGWYTVWIPNSGHSHSSSPRCNSIQRGNDGFYYPDAASGYKSSAGSVFYCGSSRNPDHSGKCLISFERTVSIKPRFPRGFFVGCRSGLPGPLSPIFLYALLRGRRPD